MTEEIKPCVEVPCPSFEEAELEVTGSAPVGHRVVDGFQAGDHESDNPNTCAVCMGALAEIADQVVGGITKMADTIRLRLSDLPESVLQLLATKTRHPQCLITKAHPEHKMWRASTSGIECGGAPKPPRP